VAAVAHPPSATSVTSPPQGHSKLLHDISSTHFNAGLDHCMSMQNMLHPEPRVPVLTTMPGPVVLQRRCLLCRHKLRRRIPASDELQLVHGETLDERIKRELWRIRVRSLHDVP
jgi:hypothetical protein